MKKARLFLLVFLIPALFQVSCKKDETPAPTGPTYKEPTAAGRTEVVTIPTGLQAKADEGTDFGAVMAVAYMGMANAISGFSSSFMVPDNATLQNKKDGSSVYYWSYGGYSYWMTYSELSDKNTWKYEYEFPDHARFTYIYAEEAKDGKSGNGLFIIPKQPINISGLTVGPSIQVMHLLPALCGIMKMDLQHLHLM